jgi:hypothetical protein
MQRDFNKKYGESKKIGDILNDIRLDTLSVEAVKNTQFAERLIHYLHGYNLRMTQLEPLYKQASTFIASFDTYFWQERKHVMKYMKDINKYHIHKRDLYEYIQDIQANLDAFENTYNTLQTKMKSITNTFVNEHDRHQHTYKVDSFYTLFMEIYLDLSEIQETYDALINTM